MSCLDMEAVVSTLYRWNVLVWIVTNLPCCGQVASAILYFHPHLLAMCKKKFSARCFSYGIL
jgi:hypothetical protein